MNSNLSPEYALSTELVSDEDPVRCLTIHSSKSPSSTELLSGSQGGIISRFVIPELSTAPTETDIQPGGPRTRHPHHITAILSSSSGAHCLYFTGCKDGIIRAMDGNTHEFKFSLEGHSNAVTSLSWIESLGDQKNQPWLVSGSWDGTAKIWNVTSVGGTCLATLSGHENTVSVAGLPADSTTTRKVVTVSAGVAEGNVIRGHTVRIWRLDSLRDNVVTSEVISIVANDHSGPMRDVCYDPASHAIYTCSNDGTVKIRSVEDGSCHTTLAYPGDNPIMLSICIVGDTQTKAVVAGTEDGNVVIWDVSTTNGQNRDTQVIGHPGSVWKVTPMGVHDFVTACQDGTIRVFTRNPDRIANPATLRSFDESVAASKSSRSSGPSAEEISKLPEWEMNALTQGRSEGQVQLFQKSGKAIAAQWSSSSRTWIEVGEVTGTSTNAGAINGQNYDHVLPIEIDVPGGGVQKLQIGYNNGENPFVTAQQFIDANMLDQNYLAEIADYIRQRAGETGPTLGLDSGSNKAASSAPTRAKTIAAYNHLPMRGYKIFDTGVDKKGLTKIMEKIREFNSSIITSQLTPAEDDSLNSLCTTLSVTNRYHSSSISDSELAPLRKMILGWDVSHAFPALDLARIVVLHPDAAKGERTSFWEEILDGALTLCLGLGDPVAKEVAVPMLTMRLVSNCYKGGSGSTRAAERLINRILDCVNVCARSDNKSVRAAVVTAVLNTSSNICASTSTSVSSAVRVLDTIEIMIGSAKYESESFVRMLVSLGTILLMSGQCGLEVKALARQRGIVSLLEGVACGNGDLGVAVLNDIRSILQEENSG